mmetsp:Transcript_117614/g.228649  ORF Transcript_117614/g.228649 Transcript_117614/m.228649 type:complete len:88 (+) Transcript_117614:252-515(+)
MALFAAEVPSALGAPSVLVSISSAPGALLVLVSISAAFGAPAGGAKKLLGAVHVQKFKAARAQTPKDKMGRRAMAPGKIQEANQLTN